MISRSQRLSAAQFTTILEKGRVVHSPLFLLRILKGTEGKAHIAAVAPGKIFKKAVTRTKIRRKIYEAARSLPLPSVSPNVHIAILAKKPAEDAKFTDFSAGLKEVFVKAGLLK